MFHILDLLMCSIRAFTSYSYDVNCCRTLPHFITIIGTKGGDKYTQHQHYISLSYIRKPHCMTTVHRIGFQLDVQFEDT